MKSYIPCNNKKKGATTEMRKLPDYEYGQVEVLKAMVTNVFDRFIAGDTPEEVLDGYKASLSDKEMFSYM